MPLRLGVDCAVIDDAGQVLLSKRGDFNIWNLPVDVLIPAKRCLMPLPVRYGRKRVSSPISSAPSHSITWQGGDG
jgi:hypothetical protein